MESESSGTKRKAGNEDDKLEPFVTMDESRKRHKTNVDGEYV